MKLKYNILLAAVILLAFGCKPKSTEDKSITVSPEAGTSYKTGDVVQVKAHYSTSVKADSVVFLVDSSRVGAKKDSSAFALKTDSMAVGPRVITARVYSGGKPQETSTNIVLLPAKAPVEYAFKVEKTFPHDTTSFTEGLIYQDGVIYESSGGTVAENIGRSNLRKVDLTSGKILKKVMNDTNIFAEGISIVGNKLIQLTWKSKIGYEYNKDTFALLKTFPNNVGVEGWGLCFDGKKLYMDDSTNRIWFLDKDNYRQIGSIDVYDDKGAVNKINELEYIDGKLYANIWETDNIVIIDPKTGTVTGKIDLTNLYPKSKRTPTADVLNGIAYDAATKRIFITGKKWPKMYQVTFAPKGGAK
ncbi:MAG: glutaminyl-peptide cyclotransferase [Mucilaginibacter sp.]